MAGATPVAHLMKKWTPSVWGQNAQIWQKDEAQFKPSQGSNPVQASKWLFPSASRCFIGADEDHRGELAFNHLPFSGPLEISVMASVQRRELKNMWWHKGQNGRASVTEKEKHLQLWHKSFKSKCPTSPVWSVRLKDVCFFSFEKINFALRWCNTGRLNLTICSISAGKIRYKHFLLLCWINRRSFFFLLDK